MSQVKPISRRKLIINTLENAGIPLMVNELAEKSNLTEQNVRNVVSSKYDSPIVYLGNGKYDLVWRAFKNFSFRYTPNSKELQGKTLEADNDLGVFLEWQSPYEPIYLIDKNNHQYSLSKTRPTKLFPYFHYQGLNAFFQTYHPKPKDNLLFTLSDFERRKFRINHLPGSKRPEEKIQESNRMLADILYDILNHLFQKQDMLFFLAYRLLPRLANLSEPPDNTLRTIKDDQRFLIFQEENQNHITIAIRKYTVISHGRRQIPVYIVKDEYGRCGICDKCGIPLKWLPLSGWIHPQEDVADHKVYRDEVELDKSFFKA